MANHKSALKRARQNDKRRERNQSLRSKAKTAAKTALEMISAAKSKDEAVVALRAGERALQKAASKGVIPRERAQRKTSRMASLVLKKFDSAKSTPARA